MPRTIIYLFIYGGAHSHRAIVCVCVRRQIVNRVGLNASRLTGETQRHTHSLALAVWVGGQRAPGLVWLAPQLRARRWTFQQREMTCLGQCSMQTSPSVQFHLSLLIKLKQGASCDFEKPISLCATAVQDTECWMYWKRNGLDCVSVSKYIKNTCHFKSLWKLKVYCIMWKQQKILPRLTTEWLKLKLLNFSSKRLDFVLVLYKKYFPTYSRAYEFFILCYHQVLRRKTTIPRLSAA